VPWERFSGWVERFEKRHAGAQWTVSTDAAHVRAPDGAWARCPVPFPPLSEQTVAGLVDHLSVARRLGVLLVRRGGFAVALVSGSDMVAVKVGRRHVQGRTKAGGWSQQRFARRRDNQARLAFDAAADHAAQILGAEAASLDLLVVGGDKVAVEHVLGDPRLTRLDVVPRQWVQVSSDPRRAALDAALKSARSLEVEIVDPSQE
jgi:hypothetical protein